MICKVIAIVIYIQYKHETLEENVQITNKYNY